MLARIMEPFADVEMIRPNSLRWYVRPPINTTYETRIEQTRPGEVLTWTNVNLAGARFSGAVTFEPAPAQRGTEVTLRMLSAFPRAVVRPALHTALQRFKSLTETGEVATLERNPSNRPAATVEVRK